MSALPISLQADKSNVLARISLLLSLTPYLGIALFPWLFSLADLFPAPRGLYFVLSAGAAILVVSGIIVEPTAIILGHMALTRAKNYAASYSRRRSAIAALILGYAFVGIVGTASL